MNPDIDTGPCPICGETLICWAPDPRETWKIVHQKSKKIHCSEEIYDALDNPQDVGCEDPEPPTYSDMLADGFRIMDPSGEGNW